MVSLVNIWPIRVPRQSPERLRHSPIVSPSSRTVDGRDGSVRLQEGHCHQEFLKMDLPVLRTTMKTPCWGQEELAELNAPHRLAPATSSPAGDYPTNTYLIGTRTSDLTQSTIANVLNVRWREKNLMMA